MDQLHQKIVLLLTAGLGVEQAVAAVERNHGLDPSAARQAVDAARKLLTLAADYARDEQLGKAVMRLEDLFAKSMLARDIKTALAAQRELDRLLNLYGDAAADADGGSDDGAARELALIEGYVRPLGLCAASYPVAEHVRVACDLVRRQGLNRDVKAN